MANLIVRPTREQSPTAGAEPLTLAQNEKLETILHALMSKIEKLEQDRDLGEKVIIDLKKSIDSQNNTNSQLLQKNANQTEQLNGFAKQIEEVKKANETLKNQLEQTNQQFQKTEKENSQERRNLIDRLEQMEIEKEKDVLNKRLISLEETLKEFEKQMAVDGFQEGALSFLVGAGVGALIAGPVGLSIGGTLSGLAGGYKGTATTQSNQADQRKVIIEEINRVKLRLLSLG